MQSTVNALLYALIEHQRAEYGVHSGTLLLETGGSLKSLVLDHIEYTVEMRIFNYVLPDALVPLYVDECSQAVSWLSDQQKHQLKNFDRWFDFMYNLGCRGADPSVKPSKHMLTDWSVGIAPVAVPAPGFPVIGRRFIVSSINYLLWTTTPNLESSHD